MKLSKFLISHQAEILSEWDRFAREAAPAGSDLSKTALRDHAKELLIGIAKDMEINQSTEKQIVKSKGRLSTQRDLGDAAKTHGQARLQGGFQLKEVAAEFRALRASVMHLWLPFMTVTAQDFFDEVVRFNEAIDDALSESINSFSDETTRIRDTFLAVLGHDLRNPLNVIALTGKFLKKVESAGSVHTAGSRIAVSSARMDLMIKDLLEYGRTQLGGHLTLKRHVVDMGRVCQAILDEVRVAHPEQQFVLKVSGDLIGSFDEARLEQVFANLLSNAARYSERGKPVEFSVKGLADEIALNIHNVGPLIPTKSLKKIFEPLVQLVEQAELSESSSHSVGLGLYIANVITQAHGGIIKARSSKRFGTNFTVLLPRRHSANPALSIYPGKPKQISSQ